MEVLQQLVAEAQECMRAAGLTEAHIVRLGRVWRSLGKWLESDGLEYTPELAERFLAEEYGITPENRSDRKPMDKERSRAIVVLRDRYEEEPYHRTDVSVYRKAFHGGHDAVLTEFLDGLSKVRTQTTVETRLCRLRLPDAALARSRMRCTTHLCQAEPWKTSSMALLKPSWASEVTSMTPATPRARILRRNAGQES